MPAAVGFENEGLGTRIRINRRCHTETVQHLRYDRIVMPGRMLLCTYVSKAGPKKAPVTAPLLPTLQERWHRQINVAGANPSFRQQVYFTSAFSLAFGFVVEKPKIKTA